MSIALCLLTILTVVTAAPISVSAKEGDVVVVNGIEIGVKQKDGSVLLNVSKDAAANGRVINAALGDNKKRSIVIPARTFKIDRAIWIGSNKTVKAKGATIYQTVPESPIIIHACKKTDYKSLENVTINGGIWKSKNNEKATKPTSTFRFNHAGNITIKNASVDTNYVSHAIELVACKNVRIYNCKLLAKGKQKNDIYAEPLQIDIATKATAPTVASYGSKYVNGQVCKNITVKKCTIKGSRGISTNKTDTENGKWLSRHHIKITIIGCTVTGTRTEALCLHNAVGVTVKNCKAFSTGSDYNYNIGCYLASLGYNNSTSKYKNVFENNTIKGGRSGLYIATYKGNKFGPTSVLKNNLYAKNGAGAALSVSGCTKTEIRGNKLYKW